MLLLSILLLCIVVSIVQHIMQHIRQHIRQHNRQHSANTPDNTQTTRYHGLLFPVMHFHPSPSLISVCCTTSLSTVVCRCLVSPVVSSRQAALRTVACIY